MLLKSCCSWPSRQESPGRLMEMLDEIARSEKSRVGDHPAVGKSITGRGLAIRRLLAPHLAEPSLHLAELSVSAISDRASANDRPDSAYNIDSLMIDGNTGTQLDVPPHSVARPDLNREKSGPLGLSYTDKIEAWQFGGEACVVDVRDLLDQAPKGVSPLVKPSMSSGSKAASPSRARRCRIVSQRLLRPLLPAFPRRTPLHLSILDRKRPAIPIPIPTAWSSSPHAE